MFKFLLGVVISIQSTFAAGQQDSIEKIDMSKATNVMINGTITEATYNLLVQSTVKIRSKAGSNLNIFLDTSGGMNDSSFKIMEYMTMLEKNKVNIKCIAVGGIMSNGMIIFSFCKNRFYLDSAAFMWHKPLILLQQPVGIRVKQLEEFAKDLAKDQKKQKDIMFPALGLSESEFERHWEAETIWKATDLARKAPKFMKKCEVYYNEFRVAFIQTFNAQIFQQMSKQD